MRTNSTPRLLLPGLAAVALGLCVAIYYPSENPISGPGAAALYAIAIVAIFLCGWEMRAIRLPTIRNYSDNSLRASGLMNFDAFATFADTALTASNQISRAVLVIGVDGLPSPQLPIIREPVIELEKTIRDAVDLGASSVATKMVDGHYAVLVSSRTSDQVLAMAEEILAAGAVAMGDEEIKISVGICFCLPSSTCATALQIARDALRLAQRNSGRAWRSIAEGGSREVTRRSVRAPALARSSSGGVDC